MTVRPIWVGVCAAARAVFVSKEVNIALFILPLLELAVDSVLALSVPETQGGEIYSVMEVYELFDDDVRRERFLELYNAAVPSQHIGPELLTIIREQVQPYFAGDKSVDETAALIQNRAQLYIGENR